jgi:LruC domain-containing protein
VFEGFGMTCANQSWFQRKLKPKPMKHLGNVPLNLLLVPNGSENGSIKWSRNREIHLPGCAATSKANTALFSTSGDETRQGSNKCRKTHRNLPFALHMPAKFE